MPGTETYFTDRNLKVGAAILLIYQTRRLRLREKVPFLTGLLTAWRSSLWLAALKAV